MKVTIIIKVEEAIFTRKRDGDRETRVDRKEPLETGNIIIIPETAPRPSFQFLLGGKLMHLGSPLVPLFDLRLFDLRCNG
jgi:hypothetical protein